MNEQQPYNPENSDYFAAIEFAKNKEQRCACMLVIDCSGSMQGRCIQEVNSALQRLADDLRNDDLAAKRVDIAIVTFGQQVKVELDFTSAQTFNPPKLEAAGVTPLGEALCIAAGLLENRKQQMKDAGVLYYRPWLIVMTDGSPTDKNTSYWQSACSLISSGVPARKFLFFPLVTEGGDKVTLQELSTSTPVRGLDSHKFAEFFQWLGGTLRRIANTPYGGKAQLSPPDDWLTIDV